MSFPIGQISRPNLISQSAGIITVTNLLAKIGGQNKFASAVSRTIATDVTLVANTRYQVFAVLVGGAVQLRISTNENSIGPAGFTAWELIGSFYANGLGSVGFGSFVSIDTPQRTRNSIPFAPTSQGFGTPTFEAFWSVDSDEMAVEIRAVAPSSSGVEARVGLPAPFLIAPSSQTPTIHQVGIGNRSGGIGLPVVLAVPGNGFFNFANAAGANSTAALTGSGVIGGGGETFSFFARIKIAGWSNIPIKDL